MKQCQQQIVTAKTNIDQCCSKIKELQKVKGFVCNQKWVFLYANSMQTKKAPRVEARKRLILNVENSGIESRKTQIKDLKCFSRILEFYKKQSF